MNKEEMMIRLLNAVTVIDFGIVCEDVDGKNWWDLRDEVLAQQEDSAVGITVWVCPDCEKKFDAYKKHTLCIVCGNSAPNL